MPNDYEGKPIKPGDRVELHPGCDLWMMGAKYGMVVRVYDEFVVVKMDHPSVRGNRNFAPERLRHTRYR
jgi:hypothetical protein